LLATSKDTNDIENRIMTENKFNFCQKRLTYANAMTVGIGILVAFAGNSFIFELHNDYTKYVFLNSSEFNPDVLRNTISEK